MALLAQGVKKLPCLSRRNFNSYNLTQSRNGAVRHRSAALAAGGLLARHFCRDAAAVWRTPVKGGSSPAVY
jgi:hypothetical protein